MPKVVCPILTIKREGMPWMLQIIMQLHLHSLTQEAV